MAKKLPLNFLVSFVSLSLTGLATTSYAELIEIGIHKSKYPAEHTSYIDDDKLNTEKPSEMAIFLQCAKVKEDILRLACFDKVAKTGQYLKDDRKQPLDLVKTVEASLQERKATPILVEDEEYTSTKTLTNSESLTPKIEAIKETDKQILENVGIGSEDLKPYTPLSKLFDLDVNDPRGILTVRPHQPMYVMPIWYSATPNYHISSPTRETKHFTHYELENLDAKMQISLKTKMLQDVFGTNADVWLGYTQQSYWQVYNTRESRPFRSSDYQPEIFITQPVKAKLPFNGDLRMLGAGLVHQSNGQSEPLSRSWNRLYISGGAEWGKLTVMPRLWFILPEIEKESDNPDINKYMGYGDIRWLYDLGDKNTVGGVLRYNPKENKGAIQIDYTQPISGGMKAYVQLFHGYGENIQDYNHLSTNIGIGLMFNDFLGL